MGYTGPVRASEQRDPPVTVLKAVLDTNLFVAAYWNPGSASARIIEKCMAGEMLAICSTQVGREVRRIIRTIRARPEYVARVERFLEGSERVDPVAVDMRAEDPDDQKFLECAAAGADYLITSDDHLLKLREAGKAEIVTPVAFLRRTGETDQ